MATILVEILGNAKQLKSELAGAQAATAKANTGFAKMQKAAGVAGLALTGGLVLGLVKSVQAADEMQQSTARMNTAFAASHVSVKAFAGRIEEAEGKSRKLGFSNDQVRGSLGSLIVATHNGNKAIKDLGVAEDIARFKHVDLGTATKLLTMAMSGSQRAVKQLGISVAKSTEATDAAKESYKKNLDALKAQFPATAKQTAAQHELYLKVKNTLDQSFAADKATAKTTDLHATAAKVIATVTQKLHGQAAAYAGTAAGGMAQFHAQLTAVAEKLGAALLPGLTSVATALASGAGFLSTHTTLAKGLVIAVSALAGTLLTVSAATKIAAAAQVIWTGVMYAATAAVWALNVAMDANPIALVIIGIAALVAAMVILYQRSGTVRAIVQGAFNGIKQAGEAAFGFLTNTVFPAFQNAWNKSGGVVGAVVNAIKGYIKGVRTEVAGVINFVGDLIHGRWSKLWGDAAQIVRGILAQLKAIFFSIPKAILTHLGDIAGAAMTIGEAIVRGVIGGIKALPGALSSAFSAALSAVSKLISSFHVSIHTSDISLGPLGSIPMVTGLSAGFSGGGGTSSASVSFSVPSGLASAGGAGGAKPKSFLNQNLPKVAGGTAGSGAGAFTLPAGLPGGGGGGGSGAASKALDALKAKLQAVADAAEKVRAAVQAKMDTAFQHIKDFALKAFDGATQAGLKKLQDHAAAVSAKIASDLNAALAALNAANAAPTASEAALAALQAQHAQQGLTDATNAASSDLATAMAGGDPAAIAAAQKAVDDAAYNQRVADLTVAAATERAAANEKLAIDTKAAQDAAAIKQAAADAQAVKDQLNFNAAREVQKGALENRLADLQAHLDQHPKLWKKTHKQIMDMFDKDFGPDFTTAGVNIGAAYIKGLKQAFADVDPIASAAATATGKANKAAGRVPHMALGGIVTRPTYALIGERGPEAVIPLGGGGGVGTTQNFYNYTQGIDEATLARKWMWQSRRAVV